MTLRSYWRFVIALPWASTDDFGWGPNNQFQVSAQRWHRRIFRRFGKPLEGHVNLNRGVDFINLKRKEIRMSDGEIVPYDILISTCRSISSATTCSTATSRDIKKATARCATRRLHGRHRHQAACPSTKSWMYFPETTALLSRHLSLELLAYMTPDKDTHYSLLCE